MSSEKTFDSDVLNSFIYWKTLPNKGILEAFKSFFPEASNIKWRMLNPDKYKVKFSYQDKTMQALFTNDGKLIKIIYE